MSGIPLHPVLVHFPIVLSVFLPLAALGALAYGFRRGAPRKAWSAVATLHAALVLSAFLAVQSGERDEDRVERVLASEAPLESHEEAGELFLKVAGIGLVATALGLAPGALGLAGRGLGSLGALGLLLLGLLAGHSGGQLVYAHGAAAAHVQAGSGASGAGAVGPGEADEDGPAAGRAMKEEGGRDDD